MAHQPGVLVALKVDNGHSVYLGPIARLAVHKLHDEETV